jgi:hypothetical protein
MYMKLSTHLWLHISLQLHVYVTSLRKKKTSLQAITCHVYPASLSKNVSNTLFNRLANVITLSADDTKSEQLFEAHGIFQNVKTRREINHIENAQHITPN